MTSDTSLEVRGIRKAYGDFVAVDDLSLKVPAGTIFGLLGPNGAGKTTTIRMIMDIIAPDSGEILFKGRPRTTSDLHRIGYLPEERGLYRKMTPLEQLVFLAELHGMAASDALPRAEEWLDRVGLADRGRKKVEELSKGMQQKVQLIGTILHEPDLVVLDEPFSGLDPINQELFKETLAQYKQAGRTILFSTHIMEQAEKLCDYICLLSDGRAVLNGPLADIKHQFGGNAYRLQSDLDQEKLRSVEGVVDVTTHDGYHRLTLDREVPSSAVLAELVAGGARVTDFRSQEPGLEEIFITAVGEARSAAPEA